MPLLPIFIDTLALNITIVRRLQCSYDIVRRLKVLMATKGICSVPATAEEVLHYLS